MIANRLEGTRILKLWILGATSFLTFWAWYFCFFAFYSDGSYPAPMRYAFYSGIVLVTIVFERVTRARPELLAPAFQTGDRSIAVSLRQLGFIAAAVLGVAFISGDRTISRAFILSFFLVLPVIFILVNQLLIPALIKRSFTQGRRLKTVIAGAPESIRMHADWFRTHESLGLEILGYIGNGKNGPDIEGLPHLGPWDELEATLRKHNPSTAVFIGCPADCGDLGAHKAIGDSLGVRVVHVWDFKTEYGFIPSIHSENGLQILGFRPEPLESPPNRIAKRTFDFLFALVVCLTILPPLILAVWVAQRLQSPGSIFFVQERRGQNGASFPLIKFRTMHEHNPDEARQARPDDDRVFAFGRFLRRFNLDEFPQFINVLLGDMSIVGPRPHLPEHDDHFATAFEAYHIRRFLKPGITGLAQVRGHRGLVECDADVQKRAQSDIQYVEEWSLFLDMSIIFQTVGKLFVPDKNAY